VYGTYRVLAAVNIALLKVEITKSAYVNVALSNQS